MDVTHQEIVDAYMKGMTGPEVAEHLGIGASTVYRHLRKGEKKTRPPGTLTHAALKRLYVVDDLSARDIAAKFGVATKTVHQRLGELNIPAKQAQHRAFLATLDIDWLREQYEAGASTYDLGRALECDPKTVYRKLRDAGVNLRPRGLNLAGEDNYMATPGVINPNYKDGSSSERDCLKATKAYKQLVQEVWLRDDWTCERCGHRGGKVHAHHVIPWAGNPEHRFELTNLVTLCEDCHRWVHSNKNSGRDFIAE